MGPNYILGEENNSVEWKQCVRRILVFRIKTKEMVCG